MASGSLVEVRDLDPGRSSRLIGLATAGIVAYGANLLLTIPFRMTFGPVERGHLTQAVVAVGLVLGPAVWLLWSAARNTGAHARWILVAVAVMILAAVPVIGADWLGSFVMLAALVLIVIRPPWSLLLFAAVAAASWPLAVALGHGNWAGYFTFVVLLHGPVVAVLVWLLAKTRQLRAARLTLAQEAVVRERLRIDEELRATLGAALEEIAARGDRAGDLAAGDPGAAARVLAGLAEDSRRTLAQARRLVRGYQTVTLRAEVDAAAALLSAAGISARVVLPTGEPPPGALESLRAQLRSGTARLLADDTARQCVITVRRQGRQFQLDMRGTAIMPPRHGAAG